MRMVLAVLVNSFLIVSAATPLLAKANTVKITIKGSNFKTPIEISDPRILANFQVWTGPGTSSNEKQGFIIDWSQGPVVLRGHGVMFRGYQVSFHTSSNDQIAYVVYYSFSPGEEQGYVYVPGESDEWYGLNVRTVFRGVEGKLFRAWDAWERVARPLIEKAEHLEADPLTRERLLAALSHTAGSPKRFNLADHAFITEGRASVRRFDAKRNSGDWKGNPPAPAACANAERIRWFRVTERNDLDAARDYISTTYGQEAKPAPFYS
jgi:hypothetical protein